MVAVMELSDRKITQDELQELFGERMPIEAAAILQNAQSAREAREKLRRLSPPAPEVDEATVWTLKVLTAWGVPEHVLTEITFKTMLANARTALSELIASKDAEIERLEGELDELKNPIYCAICGSCGDTGCGCTHKCLYPFSHPDVDAELTALRAENERLKDTIADLGVDLDEWQRCERAAGNIPPPKAAECNPAEPERRLSSEDVFPSPEKSCAPLASRSSDGSGALDQWGANEAGRIEADPPAILDDERKAAFDARVKSVGNLPVDGGFDGDLTKTSEWLWASLPVIRKWTGLETYEKALVCHLVSRIRTEAEARGRREALECAQYIAEHVDDETTAKALQPIIDELKRLMTEGK